MGEEGGNPRLCVAGHQHLSFRPGADAGLRSRRRGEALHLRRGDPGSPGGPQRCSLHRHSRQTGARLRPQVPRRLRCQHPAQGTRRQRQPAHHGLPRGPRSEARRGGLFLAALERAHDRSRRRRQCRPLRSLRCRRRQVPRRLADARPQPSASAPSIGTPKPRCPRRTSRSRSTSRPAPCSLPTPNPSSRSPPCRARSARRTRSTSK